MTYTAADDVAINDHFRRAGFARAAEPIDVNLVSQMKNVILRDLNEPKAPYRTNPSGVPVRLDAISIRHPIFIEALKTRAVSSLISAILGPNIVMLRNRHNHATLNRRDDIPYRLHRDILQWSRPIVTLIIYLESATVDNGCTHVVPGSQFLRFAGMPPDGGGGNWADDHLEYAHLIDQAVPVPMKAGGVSRDRRSRISFGW